MDEEGSPTRKAVPPIRQLTRKMSDADMVDTVSKFTARGQGFGMVGAGKSLAVFTSGGDSQGNCYYVLFYRKPQFPGNPIKCK